MQDNHLGRFLGASARQLFDTGRSVLTLAEKEGGRLFAMVGQALHNGAQRPFNATSQVVDSATTTVEKIERVIELRVARILNSMQIPTARDVQELSRRVEELSVAVDRLTHAAAADAPAARAASKSAKPARKAGARKKKVVSKRRPARKSVKRED